MCQWPQALGNSTWDRTIFTDIVIAKCQRPGLRKSEGSESTLGQRLRKSAPDLNCGCL